MAIEAQGGGYIGSNPTGVGAVYLGDMPDLLKVQQEAIDTEKDYAVLRQREKAQHQADAQALYTSLAMKEAQVRPADEQYFKQKTQDIFGKFSQALAKYNGDTSNPQFQQEMAKIRGEKEAAEIGLQASAGAYKNYLEVLKSFDAEKDDPSILEDAKRALAMSPQDAWEKGGAATWNFVKQPRKSDLLTLTNKVVFNKDNPMDEVDVKVPDPNMPGGFMTQKIKTYSDGRINTMAQGAISNPDIAREINTDYERIDPIKQKALQLQADSESKRLGRNVTPHELLYREFLMNVRPNQKMLGTTQFSPQQTAWWNHQYDNMDDEQSVKYIAERLQKGLQGDAEFWNANDAVTVSTEQGFPNSQGYLPQITQSTYYSQALNNLPLGTATVKQVVYDANKNPKIQYSNIPNKVLGFRLQNGKAHILTTESAAQAEADGGDMEAAWKVINNNTIDQLVLGSKNPIKAASLLRKTLSDMGVYVDGNVRLVQPNTAIKQPATTQQQPKGKVDLSKFDKTKK